MKKATVLLIRTLSQSTLLVLGGCGAAPPPDEAADESFGVSSQQIVGSVVGTWNDWSGQVSMRLYRCPANFVSTGVNQATCSVDPDFALVGGGAEVCSVNPGSGACPTGNLQWNPGALLTASSPIMGHSPIDGHFFNSDAGTWWVRAKDHYVATSYWLRAYAIGMKLAGANTRSEVIITNAAGAPDPNTSKCSPGLPDDFLLVGGGGFTTYPIGNPGEILVRSVPGNLGTKCWLAESSGNPFGSDPSNMVFSVGIGVRRCPVGFSGCLVNGAFTGIGSTVPTGYANGVSDVPTNQWWWATTSVGGEAGGCGGCGITRFLTDIIPEVGNGQGGVSVWSKDHVNAAQGSSAGHLVVVARQ